MREKADSELVRRQNRRIVLETLRGQGPQARIGLGRSTGLSPASITSISSQLIDDGISDIILGCTHYPLLLDYIYEIDPGLNCIDPSQVLARKLDAVLPPAEAAAAAGRRRFYSSRPGERFFQLGKRVFGHDIRLQTRMCIVNLFED